jgi:tetratricopeptide (TPR) repeat protein
MRRYPRVALRPRAGLLGLALALASSLGHAQQPPSSMQQQRSGYDQLPSYRPNVQPTYQPSSPAPVIQRTTPTQMPSQLQQAPSTQMASQPTPSEPPRRPQALASSAASLQAATACMNDQKSASMEAAIKGCDAVIGETLKNLANAYYFRGSARFGKSDFDGAIADYGQALRLDPSDADYLNSRAAAYEAKKDVDRALADYNEAIKASPNSIYAYNNRGAVYQRKGDFARAAADYGEVTKLQPNNTEAWNARCWVRAISPGQTQQALSDCTTALKIKPDAADVLDTRGFVYLKLGQTDNAIKDYDAALKLDQKLAASLYGRGIAKTRKGDRDGGNADIAAAKAIKSDIAEEFARYGLRP